jgi:hypothetical protein
MPLCFTDKQLRLLTDAVQHVDGDEKRRSFVEFVAGQLDQIVQPQITDLGRAIVRGLARYRRRSAA